MDNDTGTRVFRMLGNYQTEKKEGEKHVLSVGVWNSVLCEAGTQRSRGCGWRSRPPWETIGSPEYGGSMMWFLWRNDAGVYVSGILIHGLCLLTPLSQAVRCHETVGFSFFSITWFLHYTTSHTGYLLQMPPASIKKTCQYSHPLKFTWGQQSIPVLV